MFESSRAARLLRVVGAVLYRQAHPWTRAWFIRVHFAVLLIVEIGDTTIMEVFLQYVDLIMG